MEQAAAPETGRQLEQYARDLIDFEFEGFFGNVPKGYIYIRLGRYQTQRTVFLVLTMTAKAFPRKKRPYMFAMMPTVNALYPH